MPIQKQMNRAGHCGYTNFYLIKMSILKKVNWLEVDYINSSGPEVSYSENGLEVTFRTTLQNCKAQVPSSANEVTL